MYYIKEIEGTYVTSKTIACCSELRFDEKIGSFDKTLKFNFYVNLHRLPHVDIPPKISSSLGKKM